MGGYIAMRVIEKIDIENLILFCPAAYSRSSWNLKFGFGFTEEIRRENSFMETDIEEIAGKYQGNVLLFFGSRDSVIPMEIQEMYMKSFINAKTFKAVILEECPHPIHRWIKNRDKSRSIILTEVDRFARNCI